MMQVIFHTPIWVWPLLVYLVWGGWKSRKDYIVSWKSLLVMPVVMLIWSIYSTTAKHGNLAIFVWGLSLFTGVVLGALTVRNLKLRFDKQQNLIEVAGNWTPMILSMTIFSLRYFIGAIYGLYPSLVGSHMMLAIQCVATIISGMFTGRLVGYYKKSKTAPHVDLQTS